MEENHGSNHEMFNNLKWNNNDINPNFIKKESSSPSPNSIEFKTSMSRVSDLNLHQYTETVAEDALEIEETEDEI